MATTPGVQPTPPDETPADRPTHVLPSRRSVEVTGPHELSVEEMRRLTGQTAMHAAEGGSQEEGDGPPTAVLSNPAGRMAQAAQRRSSPESGLATPQSVLVHAVRMGLEHVPAVAMAFGEEYPDGPACADAICLALQPFERAGLNVGQVRAALLLPPDAVVPPVCKQIGGKQFVVLGPCGRGGVGSTYFAAEAAHPERLLVLKEVAVDRADETSNQAVRQARDESAILQEAGELVASDTDDNGLRFTQYSVMPFHEGPSLQSLLNTSQGHRLPPKVACWIALCVARELERLGKVWHLDLKGSNIIVTPELRAKIIDYGAGRIAPRDRNAVQLGLVMHTPQYSAPEMTSASPMATSTSDVYSLLVLLYQMLSGEEAVPDEVGNGMSFKPYVPPAHLPTVGVDGGRSAQPNDPTDDGSPDNTFVRVTRATHDYKMGRTVEGSQGLLLHLNTEDASDPSGENRSKIRRATDWHAPGKEYADAGALVRELFHDALQTEPGRRPNIGRLVRDLQHVCRRLGIDVERGPEMDAVERDETRLVGRQVSPEALLNAIRHDEQDRFLERVDASKRDGRTSGEPSYEEAA